MLLLCLQTGLIWMSPFSYWASVSLLVRQKAGEALGLKSMSSSISLQEPPLVTGFELHLGLTLLPSSPIPAPTSGSGWQEVLLIRALITG